MLGHPFLPIELHKKKTRQEGGKGGILAGQVVIIAGGCCSFIARLETARIKRKFYSTGEEAFAQREIFEPIDLAPQDFQRANIPFTANTSCSVNTPAAPLSLSPCNKVS